ncbi:hypothetical protein [Gryllotalpicola protaetiae]|uniref:Uncharacterized protein n=1 Tax=Gryllotalpicola protaetiae TaxID=2419771 RepID=A0A387BXJ4_9MICO|nr:hypothetical protein [Gryllotalpicola protaetiae]AYG03071.1 hypothetical protein D7I44_05705 [Gryllotalpicola protaetiae]
MSSSDNVAAGRDASSRPRVSPLAVALRPFGYALVTVAWFVILLIAAALALCWFVVPEGPLSAWPRLTTDLAGDPKEAFAAIVVFALVLPLTWGLALTIVGMALGPFLLAALALSRSMRPSFRHEKLTGTNLRYDTAGGPGAAVTGVAISLLPRRHTPYSLWATRVNARAWIINFQSYLGLVCLSYVEFLLVFLFRWPLHNPVGIGVVVIFAAAFGVLAVGRLRAGWRRLQVFGEDGELPTFVKLDAAGRVQAPDKDD